MAETTVVEQFAIRYGDGEVDDIFDTIEDALDYRARVREGIARGRNPADYEPMTIVTRRIRTTVTGLKWKSFDG